MFSATMDTFLLPATTQASPCTDWLVAFPLWSQCGIYMILYAFTIGMCWYVAFHYTLCISLICF